MRVTLPAGFGLCREPLEFFDEPEEDGQVVLALARSVDEFPLGPRAHDRSRGTFFRGCRLNACYGPTSQTIGLTGIIEVTVTGRREPQVRRLGGRVRRSGARVRPSAQDLGAPDGALTLARCDGTLQSPPLGRGREASVSPLS